MGRGGGFFPTIISISDSLLNQVPQFPDAGHVGNLEDKQCRILSGSWMLTFKFMSALTLSSPGMSTLALGTLQGSCGGSDHT